MSFTKPSSWALFGSCAIVVSTWAATATALSCRTATPSLAPEPGAVEVPTNTLLWGFGAADPVYDVTLTGPSGEVDLRRAALPLLSVASENTAYDAAQRNWPFAEYPVYRPLEPLEPFSEYTIRVQLPESLAVPGNDSTELRTFTTGSGPSSDVPPLPELLSQQVEPGLLVARLDFEGILVGGLVRELVEVAPGTVPNAAGSGYLDAVLGQAEVEGGPDAQYEPTPRAVQWLSTDSDIVLYDGRGPCGEPWLGDSEQPLQIRFATFGLAGNFSGWRVPEAFDEPPAPVGIDHPFLVEPEPFLPPQRERSLGGEGCSLSIPAGLPGAPMAGLASLWAACILSLRRKARRSRRT